MLKHFPTRIDTWLAVIIVGLPLLFLAQLGYGLVAGDKDLITLGAVVTGALLALYGLVLWPLRYALSDDALIIRFGLMRSQIPYDEILSVAPYQGLLKGPCLSTVRLQVKRQGKLSVEISPHDKADFLATLAEQAEGLSLDGERVVRV